MVPKDSPRFTVRLQRGADLDNSDVYLDLSASFGNAPVVVLNARRSAVWGTEEPSKSLSIPVSSPFLLVLTAALDCFEIEIVGSTNESFKSRDGLPISSVTHLAIEGGLSLREIHIPVENMPRNLRLSIPGGVNVGDMVFLRGTPSIECQNFVINLQSGPGKLDDVMFQFNPRVAQKELVLNSRLDDEWGAPEKCDIPFNLTKSFDLVVAASSLSFDTWVDGKEFKSFGHRQDMNTASTLFVEGDLCCENIVIDSPPCILPQEWKDGLKFNSRTPRAQAFNSEQPLLSRITGGLDKGCLVLLSGQVSKEPSRFHLNLQCDASDETDIALQYCHQWEGSNKEPLLILKSKDEEQWLSEARVKDDKLTLSPGMSFDLVILYTGDQFRISANGLHQADYPMNLEGIQPNHVSVAGDITVHRLLVL